MLHRGNGRNSALMKSPGPELNSRMGPRIFLPDLLVSICFSLLIGDHMILHDVEWMYIVNQGLGTG